MRECTRKIQLGREISVADGRLHEPTSGGRDSRARRDVGTLRLNGRGLAPICESFFSDLWPLSCAAVELAVQNAAMPTAEQHWCPL